MAIKKVVLGLSSIFALLFAFLMVQSSRNPECKSPFILGYLRNHNQPEEVANRFISDLGGLPKTDMDIHEAVGLLESNVSLPVYPVQEWHILTSSAMNLLPPPGSDSVYKHSFRMQVTYTDGDEAILQWSSWRYGFVACPFVISAGTGPPGHLEIVP